MSTTHTMPERAGFDPGDFPTFKVVLAYENLPTGEHARGIYHRLLRQIENELPLDEQLWRFDLLRVPELNTLAADQAAEADMVVIAGHDHRNVPRQIKSWMAEWLNKGAGRERALVVLLDPADTPAGGASPAYDYYRQAARQGGLAFSRQP